ncbi:MAG TPA: RcpC/CpaB family pilus assembly protein [Candidatus Acidoferrales bacterium]|nr:RcpC/CpaB family pilus assembly protein [Candidatus Acidoferrales bacterium]
MAVPTATSRPRPGGGRIFVILGLLLALLAGGAVWLLGTAGGGGGGITGGNASVVVAARDISIRNQLGGDDVKIQKFAQADVPPGSFSSTTDITKQKLFAELNIAKDQPITANMLARSPDLIAGSQPAYLPIPPGFVAITVPTSEQQGVAGNIHPGDYITIIASAQVTIFLGSAQAGPPKATTKTVFVQVHVLTVGAATNVVQPAGGSSAPPPASTGNAASLTVVMSQCDAEFLNWFLINASLKYTLESFHDYKPSDTTPDPTCASVEAAGGVSNTIVDKRYKFSAL